MSFKELVKLVLLSFRKKEEELSFKELVKKVGFGLAVVILDEKGCLTQDFLNNFSFDQWEEVYRQAISRSDLKQTALTNGRKFMTELHWEAI